MSDKDNERYTALMSKIDMHVEGVGRVGALDVGLICILKEASLLVGRLIKSEGDAFCLKEMGEKSGIARLESKAPGKILLKLLKLHIPEDSRFNALYKFEPYIEMALSNFKDFGLYYILLTWAAERSVSEAQALMKHFNECVDKIRQDVKSERFQSRLNSYQRSSNKNYKELTRYIEELFGRYSRLLVLRVDLSYSKENSKTTQAVAKQDRERLFGNARSNKLFDDMVGYIWKLEHGPDKGFHYHMMFFYDGSKVREDITLAKRVGEYWAEVVTKGRGLYFNCNAIKLDYHTCGIGMVNFDSAELREGLCRAVIYLTKTDLFMKLQTVGRGMGKGNRPSQKDSRGRPRAISSVRSA